MTKTGLFASAAAVGLLVVAGAAPSVALAQQNSASPPSDQAPTGNEVIVTAQKKAETIQNVPTAVTVVKGDDLAQNNQTKLEDFFTTIPGLSIVGNGGSSIGQAVTIRGLATTGTIGGGTPTVSYMIDDTIFSQSQWIFDNGGQYGIPDIDPSDIQRIEVLKGPQGTLYGADAIGGVIKVVTKDPSTAGFSAHIQLIGEDIPDGGLGYTVRGSANIPITDYLAARVSAFSRQDPGYVDNPLTGQHDVNATNVWGTHVAVLYRPTDKFSLKLSAFAQDSESDGYSKINTDANNKPTGGLSYTAIPGSLSNSAQIGALSATLNADLGGVKIVSATGWDIFRSKFKDDGEWSQAFVLPYYPTADASISGDRWTNNKFSQEVRASYSIGRWVDLLVGGFYTHETASGYTDFYAEKAATGQYIGTGFVETDGEQGNPATSLSERSVFADATFNLTDRFDVQIGGRQSWVDQAHNHAYFGPGCGYVFGIPQSQCPLTLPLQKSQDQAFTYLFTAEYKFTKTLMVYGRIASGFQVGGINEAFPGVPGPPNYGPSQTTNYEVGTKGSFFNGRLSFDASAYYIDWNQIQVTISVPPYEAYIANAGKATSQGVEFAIRAEPINGLHLSAVGSYNDAKLGKNPPGGSANSQSLTTGAQLPYSMHFSGSLTAEMDVAHIGDKTFYVGGTASYVDKRLEEFPYGATPRMSLPSYARLDLHAGMRMDRFTANLYVNNATNARGLLANGTDTNTGNTAGYYAQIIQPLTIGLSLSKDF